MKRQLNFIRLALIALFAFIATSGVSVAATSLYDYYQSNGEVLPTFAQRQIMAIDLGIRNYIGSAVQNNTLLKILQSKEDGGLFGSALPNVTADFQTSLADKISASQTTMTLVKGTDRYSTALNGLYGFVLDQGETTQEYVTATCVNTSCTGMVRGLDYTNPNIGSSTRAYIHRRGGSVKISDYPQISLMTRMLRGIDGIPNGPMYYDDSINFTSASSTTIVTKGYADGLAYAGSPNASLIAKGIVQIPTPTQVASSTASGSTGALFTIPASMASSSPVVADHIAVITKKDGKIAQGFNDYSYNNTWTGTNIFTGNATLATTTLATTTINSNFTVNATTTLATTTISKLSIGATSTDTLINGSDANAYHNHPATILQITRTMNAASAVVSTAHGLGRIPKFIKITGYYNADAVSASHPGGSFSGYSNGLSNYCVGNYITYNGTAYWNAQFTSNTAALFSEYNANGTISSQSATTTFDGTNINIGWTKGAGSDSSNIYLQVEVY